MAIRGYPCQAGRWVPHRKKRLVRLRERPTGLNPRCNRTGGTLRTYLMRQIMSSQYQGHLSAMTIGSNCCMLSPSSVCENNGGNIREKKHRLTDSKHPVGVRIPSVLPRLPASSWMRCFTNLVARWNCF